ncbi:hypothetical protein HK097_000472 [Rhizophlyctis rosea]|uniref:Uncharacterized protein n=1 Tax=Rhizophlyctis rosea TaxID=64517 RepID=A0AAD5S7B1_9FUNG|nr:hypothetical protein HK097_000472 [Rhizophlyctis rosea]
MAPVPIHLVTWRINDAAFDAQLTEVEESSSDDPGASTSKPTKKKVLLAPDQSAPSLVLELISEQPCQFQRQDIREVQVIVHRHSINSNFSERVFPEPYKLRSNQCEVEKTRGRPKWSGDAAKKAGTNRKGSSGSVELSAKPKTKKKKQDLSQYRDSSLAKDTPLQRFFEKHIVVPSPKDWETDLVLDLNALLKNGAKCSDRNAESLTLLHTIANASSSTLQTPMFDRFLTHLEKNESSLSATIWLPGTIYNRTPIHTLLFRRRHQLALRLIRLIPPGDERNHLMHSKTNTDSNVLHVAASSGCKEFLETVFTNPKDFSLTPEEVKEMCMERSTLGSGSDVADMARFRVRPAKAMITERDRELYGSIAWDAQLKDLPSQDSTPKSAKKGLIAGDGEAPSLRFELISEQPWLIQRHDIEEIQPDPNGTTRLIVPFQSDPFKRKSHNTEQYSWEIIVKPRDGQAQQPLCTRRTCIMSNKTVDRSKRKSEAKGDGGREVSKRRKRSDGGVEECKAKMQDKGHVRDLSVYEDSSPDRHTRFQRFFEEHIVLCSGREWEDDLVLDLDALLESGAKSSETNAQTLTLLHTIVDASSDTLTSLHFHPFLTHLHTHDPTFLKALALPATHPNHWHRRPLHTCIKNCYHTLAFHLFSLVPKGAQRRHLMLSKTHTNSNLLHIAASWGCREFIERAFREPEWFGVTAWELRGMCAERCKVGRSTVADMARWRIREGKSVSVGERELYEGIIELVEEFCKQ